MGQQLNVSMVDGNGTPVKRNFGLTDAADAATAGAIVTAYAKLTDCGVTGGTVTKTSKLAATFTKTTAGAGSRWWKVGRITFGLTQTSDGGAALGTIEIPGIKAAFVDASGQIIDNGTLLDGDIKNFADLFIAGGVGRLSDGQSIANAVFVSGYAYEKAHKASEN